MDAAISDSAASIVVVARDSDGNILKCWAKRISRVDPCVAEAVALTWAGEIAIEEHLSDIIVEGDSKVCIDAVLGTPDKIPWAIQAYIANVSNYASFFNSCRFCWVG